jgi:hypothetical protein
MSMSTIKPTMKLYSTILGNGQPTFRLIPVTNDCPYSEGLYDPETKVLVLMSVIKKEQFHMTPKLDDNGDLLRPKIARSSGKNYKEERKVLETFIEYYIPEKTEIQELIDELAVNAHFFNYKKYLDGKPTVISEVEGSKIITG